MLNYLRKYKIQRAFDDYLSKLGPALVKRYGFKEQYSVMQIEKTAMQLKLDMKYIPYAIALFRHEASENTINLYRIDQNFLALLRKEIAAALFNGDDNYRTKDTIRVGSPIKWRGGKPCPWVTKQVMFYASGNR